MNLRFVSAASGSATTAELLEAVADAVTSVGGNASMHVGALPDDDRQSICVVVPHDFFPLTPPEQMPPPAVLARTIGLCVARPGTAAFRTTLAWASRLGAAVDINLDSTEELRRCGVAARRFVLGYSRIWDKWQGQPGVERGIDITYLATTDVRRDHLLCEQARRIGGWRSAVLIPPRERMTTPRPAVLVGAARYDHLANSQVLLNLHRAGSPALEWVRVLQAMINGCVVVSEHSTGFAPIVPGVHAAFGRGSSLADIAGALLRHSDRLVAMRDAARRLCLDELSMRDSAIDLLEIASTLPRRTAARHAPQVAPANTSSTGSAQYESTEPATHLPEMAPWAADIPVDRRRAIAAAVRSRHSIIADAVEERQIAVPTDNGRVVDVVIAGNGDSVGLATTLSSLKRQGVAVRVLISGGRDGDGATAPRGAIRNELLRRGSEDLVLIVDPGLEFFPRALRVLVDALDADTAVVAAYPMVADTAAGVLWNSLPPERARLVREVYLGAPLLIRRDVFNQLGGFSEDPVVAGYEDHELWLRIVGGGRRGMLVPEILASGSRSGPAADSIADLMSDLTLDAFRNALDDPGGRPVQATP